MMRWMLVAVVVSSLCASGCAGSQTVEVRVLDTDRRPVEGAVVEWWGAPPLRPWHYLGPVMSHVVVGVTGPDGRAESDIGRPKDTFYVSHPAHGLYEYSSPLTREVVLAPAHRSSYGSRDPAVQHREFLETLLIHSVGPESAWSKEDVRRLLDEATGD